MVKNLLRRDKRGISILVGYVILIVLALSMAAAVYSFLEFYTPKNQAECPQDVSVIIREISCESTGEGYELNITILNKGLFSVDGADIKVGDPDRIVRTTVNEGDLGLGLDNEIGLQPGAEVNRVYEFELGGMPPIEQEVEVQARYFDEQSEQLILCENNVVTQLVICE